jgi:hypothetical protein
MVRQGIDGASVRWGRMSRWPMLLLVLCACTLGLVACGGDDSDDVDTILSETFGEGKDVKSGRLDVSLRLNAKGLQGLNGPLGLRLSGPFASEGQTQLPRFDFEAAIDAGGQQIKAGAVSTGDKGFLKLQDQAYDVGDELYKQFKDGYAQTAKCNAEQGDKSGGSFAALGVDPSRWLTDAEKAGEEKVGGADTTHVSGKVDVPKFLEDVNRILARSNPAQQQGDACATEQEQGSENENQPKPRQLSEQDRKQIADAIKDARVDIWSGDEDRMLRRMNVQLKFEVPEAERQQARGLQSGDLRFDMTIGALNEEQKISAPSDARPLEELTTALGGAAQQGAGAQGGSGQSGSQGGEAQSGGSPYEQCLADAGQDVKKLQDCAQLIGQ